MRPPLIQDVRHSESRASRFLGRQPRRRKSSLLDRWIQDQQSQLQALDLDLQEDLDNDPLPAPGSLCHPYLAYPHLSRSSLPLSPVSEPGVQRPVTPAATDDASSEFRVRGPSFPVRRPPIVHICGHLTCFSSLRHLPDPCINLPPFVHFILHFVPPRLYQT